MVIKNSMQERTRIFETTKKTCVYNLFTFQRIDFFCYPVYNDYVSKVHKPVKERTYKMNVELKATISPGRAVYTPIQVVEHKSNPIKNESDIEKIINHFISTKQMRNAMLFTVGFNLGVRVSDLIRFRFRDFIQPDYTFRDELVFIEKKTANTRGRTVVQDVDEFGNVFETVCSKPVNRHCFVNMAVKHSIKAYLDYCSENNVHKTLDDYLFVSESNNKSYDTELSTDGELIKIQKPLTRQQVDAICEVANQLGIQGHYATHTFRQTFAYHILKAKSTSDERFDSRQLQLLQIVFGHSSQANTLRYAGVTADEVYDAYQNLNLGLSCYTTRRNYISVTSSIAV